MFNRVKRIRKLSKEVSLSLSYDETKHPRDSQGRWSHIEKLVGKENSKHLKKLENKHHKNLDKSLALQLYTTGDELYGPIFYHDLQNNLRDSKPLDEAGTYIHDNLMAQMEKHPKPLTAYRGTRTGLREGKRFLKTLKDIKDNDKTFSIKPFSSLSLNPEAAEIFATPIYGNHGNTSLKTSTPFLFKVKSKKGIWAGEPEDQQFKRNHIHELIHGPNSEYKVTGIEENKHKIDYNKNDFLKETFEDLPELKKKIPAKGHEYAHIIHLEQI